MSELTEAERIVAEATADRVTWGDGAEYINVEDAARLVADAHAAGVAEGRAMEWDDWHGNSDCICRDYGPEVWHTNPHDHRDDATAIGDSTGYGGPVGGGEL